MTDEQKTEETLAAEIALEKAAPAEWKAYKDAQMRTVNESCREMRNRLRIGRRKR